jgi:pectinesterase
MITVSKDNRGDYKNIQDAIDAIPKDNKDYLKIFIYNGEYKEKILINKPHLIIEGESKESTIITYDDNAKQTLENGELKGTFRTPTVMIDTHDVKLKNITFENSAGSGQIVGQALALYVDGNFIEFEDCRFLGSQDTLFTAPLPQVALQKNGFAGPKEHTPRINGKHYYKNCYIEGTIDFIFGSATAFFDQCELFSKLNTHILEEVENPIKGYVTAASTPEGQEYGYVFHCCKFTSNCPPNSVYLGRPWRNFAKVVLIQCELGEHIKEEGWHDWDKTEAQDTVFFAEYESTGKGAVGIENGKRVSWSKQLEVDEIEHFSRERVYA